VLIAACGAAGEVRLHTWDPRISVHARELKLYELVEQIEAFIATDLVPLRAEQPVEVDSLVVTVHCSS
jgi:hypothetical protein